MAVHVYPMPPLSEYPRLTTLLEISTDQLRLTQETRDIQGSAMDIHIYPMPPLSEYPWMTKLLGISTVHPRLSLVTWLSVDSLTTMDIPSTMTPDHPAWGLWSSFHLLTS